MLDDLSLKHITEPTEPYEISYGLFWVEKKNQNNNIVEIYT